MVGTARIPARWSRSARGRGLLARSRQKRNRSSFFRFASTVRVQTWREQLYKCSGEREEEGEAGPLVSWWNARICTASAPIPPPPPPPKEEGGGSQNERSPLPIRATTSSRTGSPRTRSHRIYIYIKPPFIRDNKQSCYRREINIVTFIRGQIEGANEPTFVVCIAERSIASSTDQSFFHADKAFPARPKVIADNSSSSRANETDLSPAADSSTDPSPLQRTFRGEEKILAVVLDSSPTNRDSIRFPFPKKLANASLRNSMSLARIISRRRDARVASDQYARGKCAVNTCGARGVADDCTRPPRVDRAFSLKEEPVSHSVAHTNWIVHGVWKRSVLRTQRNIVRQTREQRPCVYTLRYTTGGIITLPSNR